MAEEKKEKWLNYLALTTVIFAVCATLSTFRGGGFSTKSVLAQSQASDQWAYFQAKSIKGYLYELQEAYSKKIKKYDEEKAKIEKDARDLETVRDNTQKHSKAFGVAVIFLQIAILLSSIAALMKKKILWILGMITGSLGLVYFVNGFFLFMK